MDNPKKISAAIAAVMHYIRMEEEAILMQQAAMGGRPQVLAPLPPAAVNPWGVNGRQTQMQMRNLMQMRAFR